MKYKVVVLYRFDCESTTLGKPNSLILGNLNINSIRNKFEATSKTIKEYNTFLVSKTKLDSSFTIL